VIEAAATGTLGDVFLDRGRSVVGRNGFEWSMKARFSADPVAKTSAPNERVEWRRDQLAPPRDCSLGFEIHILGKPESALTSSGFAFVL
jgi:hypothetical protein